MTAQSPRREAGGPSQRERVFLTVLVSEEPIGSERVTDLVEEGVVVVLSRDRQTVSRLLFTEAVVAVEAPVELVVSGLRLDLRRHQVSCGGRPMSLTESEFRLLSTLMSDGERAFPYGELETAVWSCEFFGDPARLRSAVKRLRVKLAAASADVVIEAVRGLGFRLGKDAR